MKRHVALLRGINVGKAKRVAMAELKHLIEELGYAEVTTLLNSGNVVFSVPSKLRGDPAPRIQRAIAERLGVVSRVTVVPGDELRAIVDANPLVGVADDPSRLFVAVLADPKDRKRLLALQKEDWRPDQFALGKRVAYLWLARGVIDSPLSKAFERTMGDAATARNARTMGKIVALTQRDGDDA